MLVVVAAVAAAAVLSGLARIGLDIPVARDHAAEHGPLLVLGVFGTVIALERAVAVGRAWAYLAPALACVGAVALWLGHGGVAGVAAVASALGLVLVNVAIVRTQSAAFTWLMLLGSFTLLLGTAAWASGAPVFAVAPAWMAFFVQTIVAERLEMSRLVRTPKWATPALVGISVALAALSLAAIRWPDATLQGAGGALALVGVWELRFDLARRTVRTAGLPRFAALGVLAGAAWLVVAGVALAVGGLPTAGPARDAVLHAVFVGFVLSMVFAHAPIILPAVARIELPFHPVLYAPLGLLHLSVAARVAGDWVGIPAARSAGALGNALALVLFALSAGAARALRRERAGGG